MFGGSNQENVEQSHGSCFMNLEMLISTTEIVGLHVTYVQKSAHIPADKMKTRYHSAVSFSYDLATLSTFT